MRIDYNKSIAKVAWQMMSVYKANVLVKLILRTIVRNIKVKHAGMFVYNKEENDYRIMVSRGDTGYKIPANFAKVKKDNPIVSCFTDQQKIFSKQVILYDDIVRRVSTIKHVSENLLAKGEPEAGKFLKLLERSLYLYRAYLCLPGFSGKDLIGILYLGEKKNNKPFTEQEIEFLSILTSDIAMAIKNAWLFTDLNNQIEINKRLFFQTVSALASSIEAKDKYTIGHTERVVECALKIAQNLKCNYKGISWDKFLEDLRIAALLHDIGKIGIHEDILNKKAVLTNDEREIIKQHPLIGVKIIEKIEELKGAVDGVKYHHEKYDGTGYPFHLKGEDIPLVAEIIALADSFDAMTVDRPYSRGLSLEEAITEIKRCKGTQFAPVVVDAFLETYEQKK